MLYSTFAALLQETQAPPASGTGTVKLISGVLAVILVVIIILRRKSGKKKEEEDF